MGRLAREGARARGAGRPARGGRALRARAERPQRRLLQRDVALAAEHARALGGRGGAGGRPRRRGRGRGDRRLLRGARGSTPGSARAATSRSRPPRPSTTSLCEAVAACRELGEAEAVAGAERRARSPSAAPRRPSAAAPSSPTRRRCSRRGSRSACASGCSRPASRSTSPRRCAASDGARTGSRRAPPAAWSAPGAAVLAIGGAAKGLRGPLRGRLSIASSHIVITEPVPDLLEEIGWTGGECITDSRALVDYFRTTPDGRIAFGWGGGQDLARAAGLGGRAELDPEVVDADDRAPAATSSRACGAGRSPTPGAARSTPRRPTCRWSCRCAAAAPSPPPATPATASAPPTWSAAPSPRWRSTATTKPRASPSSTPRRRASRPSPSTGSAAKRSAAGSSPRRRPSSTAASPAGSAPRVAAVPELIGFHIGR